MNNRENYRILSFQNFKNIQLQHLAIGLSYEDNEKIRDYIFEFCSFLNINGLAEIELPNTSSDIHSDFVLEASDLNERGRVFVRAVLSKWINARNKNGLKVLQRVYDAFEK